MTPPPHHYKYQPGPPEKHFQIRASALGGIYWKCPHEPFGGYPPATPTMSARPLCVYTSNNEFRFVMFVIGSDRPTRSADPSKQVKTLCEIMLFEMSARPLRQTLSILIHTYVTPCYWKYPPDPAGGHFQPTTRGVKPFCLRCPPRPDR